MDLGWLVVRDFSAKGKWILSLLMLTWVSNTWAFNQAGQWVMGLGGGAAIFSKRHHIDNTGITDMTLGYNFTDQWGFQGLFGVFNTNSTRPSNRKEHVSGNLYAFDAVYHTLPRGSVQPYFAAGPSVIGLNPNAPDANDEGGVNGAVGLQWVAGQRVALALELRDFYTITGGKNDVFPNASVNFLI